MNLSPEKIKLIAKNPADAEKVAAMQAFVNSREEEILAEARNQVVDAMMGVDLDKLSVEIDLSRFVAREYVQHRFVTIPECLKEYATMDLDQFIQDAPLIVEHGETDAP